MEEKYQNKYRTSSVRAQWWDYGWNGAYFITICTQNREHFFGEIVPGADATHLVATTPAGDIAYTCWHEIPRYFPYAELGDFVVMPNHIHGILILNKAAEMSASADPVFVETRLIASLQKSDQLDQPDQPGGFAGNKNPMLNENVSRIIRWYKGRCSFEIRKIHAGFGWQARFYDRIIRDAAEYQRISDYILANPANWDQDRFNAAS